MSGNAMENDGEVIECPLCMETLDLDDKGFFPCPCGYQICRFCWHRLSNLEDNPEFGAKGEGNRGLCPACRQEYPESPVCFNSNLTAEAMLEVVKNKKKKKKQANKQKQKQMEDKQKLKEILKNQEKNLAGLRVVQKNLVFVIGLPTRLTQEDLRREFVKFGRIHKLVITNCSATVNTAYVTFTRPEDAMKTIQALNQQNNQNSSCSSSNSSANFILKDNKNGGKNGLTLKASLGTTKYCTHWLRSQQCPKLPDCMYLHELADDDASFTKEEIQKGKHTEYEKKLINQYLNKGNSKPNGICSNQRVESNEDNLGLGNDNDSNSNSNSESPVHVTVTASNGHSVKRPPSSADSEEKIHLNTLDEIIGSSSDSISTSYSTCSSGSSSCPPSSMSPRNQQEYHSSSNNSEDQNVQKMMRMQTGDDDAMLMPPPPPDSPSLVAMDDDDGLDFDPISISTTGLQDLIRSSSEENCISSSHVPVMGSRKSEFLPSNHADVEHVWRNSLKALLPNVNITFANSPGGGPLSSSSQQQHQQQQHSLFKQQPLHHQQQQSSNISSLGSMLPQMVPNHLNWDHNSSWFSSHHHRPNQIQQSHPQQQHQQQQQQPQHHRPTQQQQLNKHHSLTAASLQRIYASNMSSTSSSSSSPLSGLGNPHSADLQLGMASHLGFLSQTVPCQPPPGFAHF